MINIEKEKETIMFKKIFILLVIAVMTFGVANQAFAEAKIGYVDLRRALRQNLLL